MLQVRGSGQCCPASRPAVVTVTAAAAAIRMFIHAATILRRTQARELLSPLSQLATWAGQPGRSGAQRSASGLGTEPTRSGVSVVILHPRSRGHLLGWAFPAPCYKGAASAHPDTDHLTGCSGRTARG